MKKFMQEFKEFAFKGNVMNLAAGVIIGAAFQGVVTSLTQNILSPIVGIFARQNFDLLMLKIGNVEIKYGAFITSVANFLIMAFVIFLLMRAMHAFRTLNIINKKEQESAAPPPDPVTKTCPYCFSDIAIKATRCPFCTSRIEVEIEG
ncbi:MAG: large conductance mechanosensitive channel protein MscL [Treponema sp.]|jgi:large conductance mechanosensitive channel|nr:large conductance mechanosensitive channel protein MscL [Treponema sp.]